MYFGSVRFFKHLIISALCLLTMFSLICAIFFSVKYNTEKYIAADAEANYNSIINDNSAYIPEGASPEDVVKILKSKGYTAEDIIKSYAAQDDETMVALFRHQFYNPDDVEAEYTKLYPDLYVTPPKEFITTPKTIYLTFDDGPSENTLDILAILDKYNIKATFFMSGSETKEGQAIMKQVADAGHKIGIHSNSHDYYGVYSSVQDYLDDFSRTSDLIYNATGVKPDICRFPGGSINNYNRFVYKQIIAEITRRGYVYYDWNVSGEDATSKANWTSIYNHVMGGIKDKDRAIILLHDSKGKDATVSVVEDLIKELQAEGYTFDTLTNDVKPVTFSYLSD